MGKATHDWHSPSRHRDAPVTKAPPASRSHARSACPRLVPRARAAGFSLVELLVVIAIVAILAGAVITQAQPSIGEGLRATARVVAADMDRARELAVAGSSSYRITFDVAQNSYRLTHTGADSRLDTLPPSPFGDPQDRPTECTQKLNNLPHLGASVALQSVLRRGAASPSADYVEFGPLGETTQSEPTVIWLASGSGAARRYISVTINPVTGVSSIGELQATSP